MRALKFLPLLLIFFYACAPAEPEPLTDYPNSHLLLQAAELPALLATEDVFLIDARAEVSDSIIPGSVHFPAISELTDPDHPVASFLIGPEVFQEKMRSIGLNNNDRVVIYDEGNSLAAARLFYALDYYGFSNTSLLNGGIEGWLNEGLSVQNMHHTKELGSFQFDVQETKSCDITYIMEAANDPNKIIFDARSEDEYTGTDVRAERGGHIPNAVNLEWSKVLQPEGTPYFLPAQEIQDIYSSLGITPDKEVIPHCHTNVRGSHAYFTLRLMGYDSVRPYEGSWAEYGNAEGAIIQ
ncbi:MAG: sulfurtransferase [Balneolaceae bacterium]|nr:sulfurtransferase [Balneolaceae bacterium]